YYEAHVLGYVRAIDSDELESMKEEGYDSSDVIGKTGIEFSAERYLRGKDGKKNIEVDVSGRLTEQQESVSAIPGSDIVLTIDANLQKATMESLKRTIDKIRVSSDKNNHGDANAGTAVAIDVKTGEVLAMASYPSFDPAVFLAGSEDITAQQTIKYLNNDLNKPQFNRAIQGTYAPGATFKPLTAIAALETGIISADNNKIMDRGKENFGGKDFFCLEFPKTGHGLLDLKKALETSCNIYFHDIGFHTGIDNLAKWAGYFGLGKKTGIDLPSEYAGYMSSKEVKKKLHKGENGEGSWYPADTAQVAIGQLDNAFTPLQLASYISAIANGGKLYKPYIVKRVIKYDGSIVNETQPTFEQIPVKASTIEAVKEGMVAVTSSRDGTAKDYFKDFPYAVAGKTGTAETSKSGARSDNALFVCYAPAYDPKIAVAVVVERGVWGSYTAPIARDILDAYFGLTKADAADDVLKPEEPVFTQ
ncbi:MAG: penicillin-binding protein 2, partial [Ruminiclostridium sp.]|nr:penicillin-binding protein 2 [Ruminiclostridium sp.]